MGHLYFLDHIFEEWMRTEEREAGIYIDAWIEKDSYEWSVFSLLLQLPVSYAVLVC